MKAIFEPFDGKILKVRYGHEANCSSGMFLLVMLFAGAVTYLPAAVITSAVQAHQARRLGEISQRAKWIPQVIGLVITVGLFIWVNPSGYNATSLGILAVVLGVGFAIAVYLGSKLAPKIGYFNILAVPLIQVGLVYILMWVVV
jgi:hypothetical protein